MGPGAHGPVVPFRDPIILMTLYHMVHGPGAHGPVVPFRDPIILMILYHMAHII